MKERSIHTLLDDFHQVLHLRDSNNLPYIIIGGHAVNLWAARYLSIEPSLSDFVPFTSKDLDLLGDYLDLERLAKATGFEKKTAEKKIWIPSCGFLVMPFGNAKTGVKIEILKRLYGIPHGEIEERALKSVWKGEEIRVPDPILLLKAKAENVVHIPQNEPGRERQDVKHVKMLIICVRAFLREQISDISTGKISVIDCLAFHQDMCEFALTKTAKKAVQMYNLNWVETMPLQELRETSEKKLKNFMEKRLPRWIKELQ